MDDGWVLHGREMSAQVADRACEQVRGPDDAAKVGDMNGRDPSDEMKRYARTRDAMGAAVAGNPHIKRGVPRARWRVFRWLRAPRHT